MFVGREEELKQIRNCLEKDHQNIVIYGKRKIGKTTLINKAKDDTDPGGGKTKQAHASLL